MICRYRRKNERRLSRTSINDDTTFGSLILYAQKATIRIKIRINPSINPCLALVSCVLGDWTLLHYFIIAPNSSRIFFRFSYVACGPMPCLTSIHRVLTLPSPSLSHSQSTWMCFIFFFPLSQFSKVVTSLFSSATHYFTRNPDERNFGSFRIFSSIRSHSSYIYTHVYRYIFFVVANT